MSGYFREWRFDRSAGQILGLDPLDPNRLPAEYWRLVENSQGQLERVEEHRPEHAKPAVKLLTWEDGRIVEALDYNPDGSLRLIHQYVYNSDGYMVDRLEFDGEEQSRGHVVSVWDQNGFEVAEIAYDPNQRLQSKHTYEYDECGRLALARYFDSHEKLNGWRRLVYDGNDRVVEKHWYGPDGKLRSRYCQQFTSDGQVSLARLYNGDNQLLSERTFAPT